MDSPCTYCKEKDKCKEPCVRLKGFWIMLEGTPDKYFIDTRKNIPRSW